LKAIAKYQVKQVIVAGGVAANKGLRAKMQEQVTSVPVYFPAMRYCTDNAAMIAAAGYFKYIQDYQTDDLYLNADSRLKID